MKHKNKKYAQVYTNKQPTEIVRAIFNLRQYDKSLKNHFLMDYDSDQQREQSSP